jgi:hypothetical protein
MFNHVDELEQIQGEMRRVIAMLRANEKQLRAEGFDVDASIAEIEDQFAQTVFCYAQTDKAHDDYLHACADLADAEAEYCRDLCALMDPLAAENPDDPTARQWKQLRSLVAGGTYARN